MMNIYETQGFRKPSSEALGSDDAKMEQIRELLHGELKRQHEARLALLEARVRELEIGIQAELAAMTSRLDALAGELQTAQRSNFDELARSILDMGERVRRMSRE